MRKLKKTSKSVYVPPDVLARKNRRWFILGSIGGLVVILAIIVGYVSVAKWLVQRDLQKLEAPGPENAEKRIVGMRNAARSRYTQFIPQICDLLRTDPSVKVRREAVDALARMSHGSAVPSLVYALGDETDAVAKDAMSALRKIANKDLEWPGVIDWWAEQRPKYEWAYHRAQDSGVPVVDDMRGLLLSENSITRLGAVQRLAKLEHQAAAEALGSAANDTDERVKSAAVDALTSIAKKARQTMEKNSEEREKD